MQLELVRAHKSIKQLPDIEINDFVILTGVNGAGKTQFLECLNNGYIKIKDIKNTSQDQIRLFNNSNLLPNSSQGFSSYQLDQERESVWRHFKSCQDQLKDVLLNKLAHLSIVVDDLILFINDIDYLEEKLNSRLGKNRSMDKTINLTKDYFINSHKILIQNFCQNQFERQVLIEKMEEWINKHSLLWTEHEFTVNYFDISSSVNIFQQSFSRLFVAYRNALWENDFNEFRAKKKNKNLSFLSFEEFVNIHGDPPWNLINKALEIMDLDFRISIPSEDPKVSYRALLEDKKRNVEVDFNDLSSGEKIIISFILCLYQSEDKRNIIQYPKLLLFDEVDASLHPSMTKMMLKIIKEILVDKLGIKVILTTHSPSTVALAPEDTLYVMSRNSEPRLKKVNKDKALSILTAGIPTLSIDPDNRRQILVESQHDAYHYEKNLFKTEIPT